MAMAELARTDPQIAKTALLSNARQTETVTMASRDPHIHRLVYRFYRGALYELAISYRPDRVPRGYDGLLDRLKQDYGRPVAENIEDFDLSRDIFSTKKTVWRDDATRITLAEVRKLTDGREQLELVLTMTDLSLEQARDQAVQEQLRRKELSVPIPLPDRQGASPHTARPSEADRLGTHS
jgi:ribosome-binding protein aMBF1 (putative translation factor)